jgi:uncharacterized protein with von Willebrand factor type A (vWA) domain
MDDHIHRVEEMFSAVKAEFHLPVRHSTTVRMTSQKNNRRFAEKFPTCTHPANKDHATDRRCDHSP